MPKKSYASGATLLVFLVLTTTWTSGQTESQRPLKKEFDVAADGKWVDTGIDVKAGEVLNFTARGTVRGNQRDIGPDGTPRGWRDLIKQFPLNGANVGALIGRIGSDAAARSFLLGAAAASRAAVDGRLFLGTNLSQYDRFDGSFRVTVEIAASPKPPVIDTKVRIPQFTQEMLEKLPTRVVDPKGAPGDRVNFVIVGSEQQVRESLQAAGWVVVNRSTKDAVVQAALATFSRQAYTQLPMSELYMFDRPQDYGYAQGDPLTVVASRHHFRIWKAPFNVDGQMLWAGAGTHDIGFDKDQRGGITHKIDPDTDKERDYIGDSLNRTGNVAKLDYLTAANAVTRAKTAHGEEYHSDGRTLVVVLKPDSRDRSQAFADLFCTVLKVNNPDGGEWDEGSKYLLTPGVATGTLGAIPNKHRILIVPGLMNTCFSGAPAFKEGQEYLRTKYGLTIELLSVPNNSCEDNARQIAEYLRSKMKDDTRKYIAIGYSKGTPDLQVALATEPDVRSAVAAFINVAGASGGSPVADSIPGQADRWIRQYNLPGCQGDLSQGFKSLAQPVRKAFLARYPELQVPTYSIPAVSDESNTSKMLMQTWQLMKAFGDRNDSQLLLMDAIIPGSVYLGAANADHFAIALPFESSNESVKSGADRNHYPRSALLEALIRFAIQDLEKQP
jgi:hypothetical protein